MNSIVKLAVRVVVGSLPLLAVTGAPARAAVPRAPTEVVVRYGDLDLDTHSGAQQMYSRLDHAARTVCGDARSPLPLEARHVIRLCEQQAMHQAIEQLGRTELTTMYTARG